MYVDQFLRLFLHWKGLELQRVDFSNLARNSRRNFIPTNYSTMSSTVSDEQNSFNRMNGIPGNSQPNTTTWDPLHPIHLLQQAGRSPLQQADPHLDEILWETFQNATMSQNSPTRNKSKTNSTRYVNIYVLQCPLCRPLKMKSRLVFLIAKFG